MIFLLGVVWVISKAVVAAHDRRKERKIEKIKRNYHSQSLPPPSPSAVKGMKPKDLDDTGVHVLRELEAERTDRERLSEIHRRITEDVDHDAEWQGKMLAIEAKQNELLRTILTEVRQNREIQMSNAEQFDKLAKYYAAMLDAQSQTNELLRQLMRQLAPQGGAPTTGSKRPSFQGD